MATGRENLFDAVLVKDLMNKVKGKSSLAVLSGQTPIPFNGLKEFIFSMDNEIDIVAENGKKSEGGITVDPVKIVPIKFEYGARVSDEFLYATEEEQLDILTAFNNGFAAKVAKGFDLAAFHGINPRTGGASTVVGTNHFDSKVTQKVEYTKGTPDTNLDAAIAMVQGSDGDVTGIALSNAFGADMATVKENGVRQYPEFRFWSIAGISRRNENKCKQDCTQRHCERSRNRGRFFQRFQVGVLERNSFGDHQIWRSGQHGKRFKRLQPGLHPRRSLSRMGNSCAGIFRKGGRRSLIYRNKRTGNVIETQCELKGGDWEAEKPPRSTTKKRKTVKKDE